MPIKFKKSHREYKRGVPTGVGGKTPGPRGQRGGTPPGGGGFGAADFGPVSGEFV